MRYSIIVVLLVTLMHSIHAAPTVTSTTEITADDSVGGNGLKIVRPVKQMKQELDAQLVSIQTILQNIGAGDKNVYSTLKQKLVELEEMKQKGFGRLEQIGMTEEAVKGAIQNLILQRQQSNRHIKMMGSERADNSFAWKTIYTHNRAMQAILDHDKAFMIYEYLKAKELVKTTRLKKYATYSTLAGGVFGWEYGKRQAAMKNIIEACKIALLNDEELKQVQLDQLENIGFKNLPLLIQTLHTWTIDTRRLQAYLNSKDRRPTTWKKTKDYFSIF